MKFSNIVFLFLLVGCQQKGKLQTASKDIDCKSIPQDSAAAIVACLFDFDTARIYSAPICLTTEFGSKIILGTKPDSTIHDFLITRSDPNGVFQNYWPSIVDYLRTPNWTDENGYGTIIYTIKDYRGYLLEVNMEAPFSPEDRRVLTKYFPCFQELSLPLTGNFETTRQHSDFKETFTLLENGAKFSYRATLRRL
jgi:hypothetical protein